MGALSVAGERRLTFEVLVTGHPLQIANEVAATLREAFLSSGATVSTLEGRPPSSAYSESRRQYNAELLVHWVSSRRTLGASVVVAVMGFDAYVPGLNFVFGLASPPERVAIVFTARLGRPGSKVFAARLRKEVIHEVGHVLGLGHCAKPLCVMFFSNSLLDTDRKSWAFCRSCVTKLGARGYRVGEGYVLGV